MFNVAYYFHPPRAQSYMKAPYRHTKAAPRILEAKWIHCGCHIYTCVNGHLVQCINVGIHHLKFNRNLFDKTLEQTHSLQNHIELLFDPAKSLTKSFLTLHHNLTVSTNDLLKKVQSFGEDIDALLDPEHPVTHRVALLCPSRRSHSSCFESALNPDFLRSLLQLDV